MIRLDLESQTASCTCCRDEMSISRKTIANPERLTIIREAYEIEHAKCHEFADARKAQLDRNFRKAVKRLLLVRA